MKMKKKFKFIYVEKYFINIKRNEVKEYLKKWSRFIRIDMERFLR